MCRQEREVKRCSKKTDLTSSPITASTMMLVDSQLELNTYVPASSNTNPNVLYTADEVARSAISRKSP